jgi:ABC-type polysaccharide/polyol phosphate transport system ATPase subunit
LGMKKNQKSKVKNPDKIAIKLTNVTKRYTIHHEKPTLVEKFITGKDETFFAIKNISLEIKKGERVGIIGPNGSGKTTLLKIIAGITSASKGKVETYGKIVSLIDLEAGFHPDLTGEQNIYLNGMLLGMKREEIARKLTSIIQFSDISQFIDTPLFTYSQGMKLRLGFSIVAHTDPDIVLLDENMAVGDQDFWDRSYKKIREFFVSGKTVVLVSHYMDLIKKNCDKVIWLDKGGVRLEGKTKELVARYEKDFS